jgi:abortive infection bacteriophage resistance protein
MVKKIWNITHFSMMNYVYAFVEKYSMSNVINSREIIKELQSKGLQVIDKSILNYYIRNFNYNTFVYGYSEPFYVDCEQKKYDESATSDQIINLYKFDRDMANHILRFILVIEKIMNTNVAYEIINEYNIRDKKLFKLDSHYIEKHIMPNINEIIPRTSYNNFVLKLVKYLPSNNVTKSFCDRSTKDEIYR